MIKKKRYGSTLKEQLIAGARDRLVAFSLSDGQVRGSLVQGTRLVNEMRANHRLDILQTMVLGRVYLAALLMAANLKGNDRLSIQIKCSGPIGGVTVEANAFGEVRGYLKNASLLVEKPLESFDLSSFFGAGLLSVIRYPEGARQPFTGTVALQYGNVAKDLANYYLTSEQIPTAFHLSIFYDKQGEVAGAGGLLLQTMPGAGENLAKRLEQLIWDFPSPGEEFSKGREVKQLLTDEFKPFSPKILAQRRVEFMCHCNRGKVRSLLTMLPVDELKDMLDNGPFPIETACRHCNTAYEFNRREIRKIYGMRFPNN
ncbi:MAG: protein HslO [Deltaproteobacteria bacterium SG8_13]|nr:MAG: protein HslO [Deltaproteobacteria bacterium SG8_13]